MSKRLQKDGQPKRSSTRTVVVSKNFRVVDSDTRKEFRDKRIEALEADNYVEEQIEAVDDEGYGESEVGCSHSS